MKASELNYKQIIKDFKSGKAVKQGKYQTEANLLLYKDVRESQLYVNRDLNAIAKVVNHIKSRRLVLVEPSLQALTNVESAQWVNSIRVKALQSNVIAKRIDKLVVGNASVLDLVDRNFGRTQRFQTMIQEELAKNTTMIPFNVFEEAKLDLDDMVMIEKGKAEKVTRTVQAGYDRNHQPKFKDETVHFTGAALFSVGDKTFLFDIDRREVEHKIFNPFLVQLPMTAKTIKEAYDLLKPIEVRTAELEGKKVLRQGEWFFIPVELNDSFLASQKIFETKDAQGIMDRERFMLQAGDNRPNYASKGFEADGKAFVMGSVEHSGREHAPIKLKQWHRAIPNTATNSFTIVGEVD